MSILAVVLLSLCFLSSCSAPDSQRADPTFDARVARPGYATLRGPRVLIDAAHHNFHTAAGRYQPFAKLLSNDGCRVTSGVRPFEAGYLRAFDILVVANALGSEHEDAPAFTASEVRAVKEWVRMGGSLLLIADHWPFGAAASGLSEAFGVDMCKGITEDSVNCDVSVSDPTNREPSTLVFSRENGLLADHRITNGRGPEERVRRVVTFTGQSLGVPEGAAPILRLGRTAQDLRPLPPTVIRRGNDTRVYPRYSAPVPASGRAQGVALELGAGRVVVLGEAAMLTAQIDRGGRPFGMSLRGNDDRRLALNVWLSRLD